MSLKIIPYGRQDIREEDIEAVIKVLKSDFLTQGPNVDAFEIEFARYVGATHAVAFNNATAALHLAVKVLGVAPGKRVITTPNSFVATANCVLYAGGDVHFSDIDPHTFNLDPNQVEDSLKADPNGFSGIIPVHFAGLPAAMEDLSFLAKRYGLWMIEDACHAPGATLSRETDYRIGSGVYSDICSFSFHPVKHIACGEGGMLTTASPEIANKLKLLRSHGITKDPSMMSEFDGGWDMEMLDLGYNYRISDILCALGTSQLQRAEISLCRRKEIALTYLERLSGLPISFQQVPPGYGHAYHLFVIRTKRRKALYEFLRLRGIYSQVHYIPIHQQPYYVNRYGKQQFPEAESYYQEALSLPMYQSLTDSDQNRVIEALLEFFSD
jgi:UDP-4-amino-4,6-dideoxy-N-acetyl-beta-L-altrosamine transaminase